MKKPRTLASAEAEIRRLENEMARLKDELDRQYRENRFRVESINAAVRRQSWNGSS